MARSKKKAPANRLAPLLKRWTRAVLTGDVTPARLVPVKGTQLGQGWKWVVEKLQKREKHAALVATAQTLWHHDPTFPPAHFFLGSAYLLHGELGLAAGHFRRQLEHPSGVYRDESRTVLEKLASE